MPPEERMSRREHERASKKEPSVHKAYMITTPSPSPAPVPLHTASLPYAGASSSNPHLLCLLIARIVPIIFGMALGPTSRPRVSCAISHRSVALSCLVRVRSPDVPPNR